MTELQAVDIAISPAEKFREYLATKGQRLTTERQIIVEEIFADHEHFDVDQIVSRLTQRNDGRRVSRSTVYRTLRLMVETLETSLAALRAVKAKRAASRAANRAAAFKATDPPTHQVPLEVGSPDNPYGLPNGKPIESLIRKTLESQRAAIRKAIRTTSSPVSDDIEQGGVDMGLVVRVLR